MFNKLDCEVGLLSKRSCLGAALGANKFIKISATNLITLSCAA
jgi:hypothetical protein